MNTTQKITSGGLLILCLGLAVNVYAQSKTLSTKNAECVNTAKVNYQTSLTVAKGSYSQEVKTAASERDLALASLTEQINTLKESEGKGESKGGETKEGSVTQSKEMKALLAQVRSVHSTYRAAVQRLMAIRNRNSQTVFSDYINQKNTCLGISAETVAVYLVAIPEDRSALNDLLSKTLSLDTKTIDTLIGGLPINTQRAGETGVTTGETADTSGGGVLLKQGMTRTAAANFQKAIDQVGGKSEVR